MGKKKSGNNIQKKSTTPKKQEIKYEAQQDVQLTAYTLIAMLAIAVSGATTALAGAILAKPFLYFLDIIYGGEIDEMMVEVLSGILFQDAGVDGKVKILLITSVVVVGIAAVISLIDMIRAMAPDKKPLPVIPVIALVVSIVSVVLFAVATKIMYDNCDFANINKGFNFNIYVGVMIAHICNIIMMIANVIGNRMGLKRYEKDGKAY